MFAIFANPARFSAFARIAIPVCTTLAAVLFVIAGVWALVFAPADYQQGETARIMYIHVPAAWVAMGCYSGLVVASIIYLVWGHVLADFGARAIAPIGAAFTALCLITGSFWGRPTWGTWWEWDGRMTSVLVLLFLYLGYIALRNAMDDPTKSAKAGAILALVGVINLPIIRYSVVYWNSLHQQASIIRAGGPTIDASMLYPLLLMGVAYLLGFAAMAIYATVTEMTHQRIRTLQQRLARQSEVRG